MKKQIDREAGWRETLAEVSLADVGSQLKSLIAGMIVYAVWFGIYAGVGTGASALGLGFHVPAVVWVAFVVFVFVMAITSDRSHHEWTIRFFFPKMGIIGWSVTTAYITLVLEAFQLSKGDDLGAAVAGAVVYFVFVAPAVLLFGLLELGHNRLMEKRLAAVEAGAQSA